MEEIGSYHESSGGSYLLLARLDAATELRVGRLGQFKFPVGWYTYSGSARGPGGMRARLARHARSSKRLHWHIDYLLLCAELETSWSVASETRLECAWAEAVRRLPSGRIAVPRFGASDCRCPGHLIHLGIRPSDAQIAETLRAVSRLASSQEAGLPVRRQTYGASVR
jgi:Uri superfamily endonuclease